MKSKIWLLTIVIFWTMLINAQPPNNTIFFGSTGDGFTRLANGSIPNSVFSGSTGDGSGRAANAAASNNIFIGGTGDGWNKTANITASNNIFSGGIGDGWDKAANVSGSNTIFIGGIGDGWIKAANTSVSNTIFIGGIGDGWNTAANASASNNIFFGGDGDGWSNIYLPMGPLPVTLLYFNAQKQGETSVLLNWRTSQEINSALFDVERSTDALNYTSIGKVTAAGNSQLPVSYYFTDNQPVSGLNYYRLKQVDIDGHFVYTPSRLVRFDNLDPGSIKYYPNPTGGILNIELTANMRNEVKVITISNAAGIVVNQFRLQPSANSIIQADLSSYAKGIYFIQVICRSVNSTQRIVLQ